MIAVLKNIGNTPAKKVDLVEFNYRDYDKYLELWKKHKNAKIIQNDSINDCNWTIITGDVNVSNVKFKFSEVEFKKLINKGIFKDINYEQFLLSIKSYILYMLDFNTGQRIVIFVNQLKKLFKNEVLIKDVLNEELRNCRSFLSSYFMISEYFAYIEMYFNNSSILEDYEDCYLKFASDEYSKEKSVKKKERRALPSFESMFKFNDIIEDFIQNAEGIERERFFPIILWWKITSIIPLRAHEVVLIPLNCIRKYDNKNIFKFYRNNLKGGISNDIFNHSFEECYTEQEFPISDEIVQLINEYKSIVDKYDKLDKFYVDGLGKPIERKFLFSYRSYKQFRDYKNTIRDEREFFSSNLLNILRKQFLIEIVMGKYNVNIIPKTKEIYESEDIESMFLQEEQMEYIQLMDTRHFAILNMIYMGFEASTIQRVVGHKNINTSFSYSDHSELFIKCYTISMAKQMALKKNSKQKNEILDMNLSNIIDDKNGSANQRYKIIKNKRSKKDKRKIELSEGYCTYEKDDMMPCKIIRGNHRRCPYFIPKEGELLKIDEELREIDEEISSEIKTLNYLVKNRNTLIGYKDAYKTSVNKIHSKAKNKAEILCDYVIDNNINVEG